MGIFTVDLVSLRLGVDLSTQWASGVYLNRFYKSVHAAPKVHFPGQSSLVLLTGMAKELDVGATVFAVDGNAKSYIKATVRRLLFAQNGSPLLLVDPLPHIGARPWLETGTKVSKIDICAALSAGRL